MGVGILLIAVGGCSSGTPRAVPSSVPSSTVTMSDEGETLPTMPTTSATSTRQEREPSASAEEVCADLYAGRGLPPVAESQDLDDQMALEADWHSDLLADAVDGLEAVDVSDELVILVAEAAVLQQRAAELYAEHVIVSQELNDIQARQDEIGDEVQAAADDADAPSCAALVVDP